MAEMNKAYSRPWIPAAGVATLFSAFQLMVLLSGFSGASGDDFFRAMTLYLWSRDSAAVAEQLPAIDVLWFPLHWWVSEAFFCLTGRLVFSLTALSMAAYWVSLVGIFHLAQSLFDRCAGWVSLALAGFIPLHIWMGISMTEMSWYYAALTGGALFLARWHRTWRPEAALLGGFFFLAATALRPEAWAFAGLFTLFMGWHLLQGGWRHKPGRNIVLAAACLPWCFIVFWLVRNYIRFDNPLYFLEYSRNITGQHIGLQSISAWAKALQFPFFMAIISPLLFVLTAFGIAYSWRSFGIAHRRHLFLTCVQLAMLMAAAVWGAGTKAVPQRYVLGNVLLLVPFAGAFLARGLRPGRLRAVAASLLALYCVLGSFRAFGYPTLYQDAVRAARSLRPALDTGAPHTRVCTELGLRTLRGEPLNQENDFLILASEHVAVMVYSGHPDRILFGNSILKQKAELLEPDYDTDIDRSELDEMLHKENVGHVLLSRRESMSLLSSDYSPTGIFGDAAIFSRDGAPVLPPVLCKGIDPLNVALAPGVHLTGFCYLSQPLPRRVVLQWQLDTARPTDRPEMRIRFVKSDEPTASFARNVPPLFAWYPTGALRESAAFQEAIGLELPPGHPAGLYSPHISLVYPDDRTGSKGSAVELPPVPLIHSKRSVLVHFVNGTKRDWKLLAVVLFSL